MTRLLRVVDEDKREEVDTSSTRLAGLYDALLIAQEKGDGRYIYDYQNGTYQELEVLEGKVQPFEHDAVKYGEPAKELDELVNQGVVSNRVSAFGGMFTTSGEVGTPVNREQPAVEEF